MKKNHITTIGIAAIVVFWLALTVFAWVKKPQETSITERRALAQAPTLTMESLLAKGNSSFMSKFEKYALDQFPGRDSFRQVKSVFSYHVMQNQDNNGIYIEGDHIGKIIYPYNAAQLDANLNALNEVYNSTVKDTGSNVYVAVIPDKGYYLAEKNGYLAADYEKLFGTVKDKMPWATYIDLTDTLTEDSYYFTDHHWRQEKILPAANKLADAMGVSILQESDYTKEKLQNLFYGTYFGQAALPRDGEPLYLMKNPLLDQVEVSVVLDQETKEPGVIYDMSKADSRDLYEVFMGGSNSGVTEIINPQGDRRKELIVFRDSYSCSMMPLMLKDYYKVTLVDLRLVDYTTVNEYVRPRIGKDVLFLYSIDVITGLLVG